MPPIQARAVAPQDGQDLDHHRGMIWGSITQFRYSAPQRFEVIDRHRDAAVASLIPCWPAALAG
jgi:hypothetical protein